MEELTKPTRLLYKELIDGNVYSDVDEAVQDLRLAAVRDLDCLFFWEDGGGDLDNETLLARKDQILEGMDRLKKALEKPELLIEVYENPKLKEITKTKVKTK